MLPAIVIVSVGMGLSFVAMSSTSLLGVKQEDAGVASALVNTTQQTGGSLGAALINTIATGATASYLAIHGTLGRGPEGRLHPRLHDRLHVQRDHAGPRRSDRVHPHQGAQGDPRPRSRRSLVPAV